MEKQSRIIPSNFMTNEDMMNELGLKERALFDLRKSGKLPYIKVGRKVMYDPLKVRIALGIESIAN